MAWDDDPVGFDERIEGERRSSGLRCLEPDPPVDWSCLKYRATRPAVHCQKYHQGGKCPWETRAFIIYRGQLEFTICGVKREEYEAYLKPGLAGRASPA